MSEICVFCNNPETIVHTISNRAYHQCPLCGGFFLDTFFYLKDSDEKIRYELHDNSLENTGYRTYLENFCASVFNFPAIMADRPQNLEHILDYGSGPEPSLAKLMQGQGRDVRCFDPFFAPVCPDFFSGADLVTCLEVAEHFRKPERDFGLIAERIRPGGFLALGTHLIPELNAAESVAFFKDWWYRQDLTHVSFYTEKSLRLAAASAGFEWLGSPAPHVYVFTKIRAVSP